MGRKKKRRSSAQGFGQKSNLTQLWIDGCYFDQTGQSGGALIETRRNGCVEQVICFALNHINITQSKQSELWTLAIALKQFEHQKIGALYFDNSDILSAVSRVRKGSTLKHNLPEDLKIQLRTQLDKQKTFKPMHVSRREPLMQMADNFAKAAAGAKNYDLTKITKKFHNPRVTVLDFGG